MWNYEKRLQYPVNIKTNNADLAQAIISQFGGPDGELAASMRYLSQRYTMPNRTCMGMLTDIGTEAPEMFQHLRGFRFYTSLPESFTLFSPASLWTSLNRVSPISY